MFPKPVRALLRGASLILGGVFTLKRICSATVGALHFAQRIPNGSLAVPCQYDSWTGLVLDGPQFQEQLKRWVDSKAQGEETQADTTWVGSRFEEDISKGDQAAARHLEAEEGNSREVGIRKVPSKFNDYMMA